ncbi:MAG TPA: DUF2087 domain-containing protein [Bacillota bacterium]|jgi:hypothetical protein|nr:DUF2087 domain-containing protein [Bacillota bacterium]
MEQKIKRFLDEQGRLKQIPSKSSARKEALQYLSGKFVDGVIYTEKEVNRLLTEWSTVGDYFILRRGLIENKLLERTADGSEYWKGSPAEEAR